MHLSLMCHIVVNQEAQTRELTQQLELMNRVTDGNFIWKITKPKWRRLPISFHLLDQCYDPEKRHTICESFVPNPSWKHFQRPTNEAGAMGFGYPKFISHEAFRNVFHSYHFILN